jgi:V/A-type H+-transporting ATPase subunit K
MSTSFYGPLLVSFAALIAVVLPGYGSAKVVSRLGQVATGILSEDPSLFGRLLILQALPGTQGIYGLLGWFMIMNQSGMMSGNTDLSVQHGLLFILAALPVAIIGLLSAFHQGAVAESGMALLTKQPQAGGNAIVLAVMVETYAILALLATVLGALSISVS